MACLYEDGKPLGPANSDPQEITLQGKGLYRFYRETNETVPVLMFSALSGDDDVERARLAGANHLITKPFNLVGLGAVVGSFFQPREQTSDAAATESGSGEG